VAAVATVNGLRRADAVKTLRIIRCAWVGESKLAGRHFSYRTQHSPVALSCGKGGGRDGRVSSARGAREIELETAIGQPGRTLENDG